nr:Uncharacterised protein [Citrobacter werkmanii]
MRTIMHFFVIQITYLLRKYHNKMNKKLKKSCIQLRFNPIYMMNISLPLNKYKK